MPGVSTEQIEVAKQVDILDYLMRREPNNLKKVGNRYILRDHDSFVISNGKWCWNSRNIGCKTGTALNYLIEVRNFSFVEAVRELSDGQRDAGPKFFQREAQMAATLRCPPEPKKFALPPRNTDNKRVIAYLQSRGIDRQLIVDCIKRASLYESAKFHNCVFVGRDNKGKSRFASMRGTLSDFRLDVGGSDKRFGFIIPPSNPNSTIVALYEAPIDALSHQTLCNQKFIEPFDGWRLSLGGTSLLALTHFLENHPKINICLVCTDNDDAGNLAADKIAVLPGITSVRSPPSIGNDFNEMLLALQKAERMNNHAPRGAERS